MHYEPIDRQPRLEKRLAERLTHKKAVLDSYRPLRSGIVQRLHEDLRIRLTYHSNAIEGNTLTLRETQVVIEEGITIGGHTLREHLEATNHAHAFDLLRSLVERKEPMTLTSILAFHQLVLHDLNPTAGQFRSGPVYIRGSDLVPPHHSQVAELMKQWITWINRDGLEYDPIVRAAIAHHGFVAVHPFEDGNGRTARLVLNMQLLRDDYAPAFLLREWKGRYLHALSNADRGDYTQLVNLIGQAVEEGLDFYLDACNARPDEHYQLLADIARATGRDPNYLGLLVRQGKLEAVKRGGRWYSTLAAVQQYDEQALEGLQRRGRPPKKRKQVEQ